MQLNEYDGMSDKYDADYDANYNADYNADYAADYDRAPLAPLAWNSPFIPTRVDSEDWERNGASILGGVRKSETSSTSGSTKWWHCHCKIFKKQKETI